MTSRFALPDRWFGMDRDRASSKSTYRPLIELLEVRAVPAKLDVIPPPPDYSPSVLTENRESMDSPFIGLIVADFDHDGKDDFAFCNEKLGRLAVEFSASGKQIFEGVSQGMFHPNAARLGDVNGDHLWDLVVANGSQADVRVYLGNENGSFGPGQIYNGGELPASLTLADVNNDGCLDVLVADWANNRVQILLGGTNEDHDWALTQGPTVLTGAGPVTVVARDVTGDNIVDLLIANHLSSDIYQINGLGGGIFDDAHPIIFKVGANPQDMFVGEFDGKAGLDMVTVNAWSGDLTFFSNAFTGGDVASITLKNSGIAGAALAGDYNDDGYGDLVVANRDNGSVSFLLGSADGLHLEKTVDVPGMTTPTDLAWSTDGKGIYVAGDGLEAARLIEWPAFSPSIGQPPIPTEAPDSGSNPLEPDLTFKNELDGHLNDLAVDVALLPLSGSALGLVPSLSLVASGSLESESSTGQGELHLAAEETGATGLEAENAPSSSDSGVSESADALLRFTSGQDELLALTRLEARGRLFSFDLALGDSQNSVVADWIAFLAQADPARLPQTGQAILKACSPPPLENLYRSELLTDMARWLQEMQVPTPLVKLTNVVRADEPENELVLADGETQPLNETETVAADVGLIDEKIQGLSVMLAGSCALAGLWIHQRGKKLNQRGQVE